MELRRATASDAEKIAVLEAECFPDAWEERDVLSCICSEGAMCFVAVRDGVTCGYILGRKILPEGEIYRIAVKPDMRGRGIGYRLLSFALSTEWDDGVETTFLEVREQNIVARRLYIAAGFEEISVRKNYYKNPTDNAIIMIKGLKCQ